MKYLSLQKQGQKPLLNLSWNVNYLNGNLTTLAFTKVFLISI